MCTMVDSHQLVRRSVEQQGGRKRLQTRPARKTLANIVRHTQSQRMVYSDSSSEEYTSSDDDGYMSLADTESEGEMSVTDTEETISGNESEEVIATFTRVENKTLVHDVDDGVDVDEPFVVFDLEVNKDREPYLWHMMASKVKKVMKMAEPDSDGNEYTVMYEHGETRGDEKKGEDPRQLGFQKVTAQDVVILFGPQMKKFLDSPALRKGMTRERAERLGLSEATTDNSNWDDCEQDEDWTIKKFYCSLGKGGDEVEGDYYAIGGDDPKPYRIDLYTMSFRDIEAPSREECQKGGAKVADEPLGRIERIIEIDSWCSKHKGEAWIEDRAMARPPSEYAIEHFMMDYFVLYRDHVDECLRAALANAVVLTHGRDLAVHYWKSEMKKVKKERHEFGYRRRIRDFKDLQKGFSARYCKYTQFQKVSLSRLHALLELPENSETQGVYLARVSDVHGRRHAVAIDAKSSPGLIFDSAEEFAMDLNEESFKLCCGEADPAFYHSFDDVRRIVVRKPTKGRSRGTKRCRRSLSE